MDRKNFKAIASFEDATGLKCVDLIQTEDNFFTFKTFRRDPEDPSGWFQYGVEGQLYATKERYCGAFKAESSAATSFTAGYRGQVLRLFI